MNAGSSMCPEYEVKGEKLKMRYISIVLFLLNVLVYSYDCPAGKTKETYLKEIEEGAIWQKYLEVEVSSTQSGNEMILANLRSMVINRIMKDSIFKAIYLTTPEEKKDSSIKVAIELKSMEEINSGKKFAGFVAGGLIGGILIGNGNFGIQAKMVPSSNEENIIGEVVLSAKTSGGISTGKTPYQSIVCVAKSISEIVRRGKAK